MEYSIDLTIAQPGNKTNNIADWLKTYSIFFKYGEIVQYMGRVQTNPHVYQDKQVKKLNKKTMFLFTVYTQD